MEKEIILKKFDQKLKLLPPNHYSREELEVISEKLKLVREEEES